MIKTRIFCFSNVSKESAQDINRIFGFQLTNNLEKYLRLPFVHGRVNKSIYSYLVDKVQNKLNG